MSKTTPVRWWRDDATRYQPRGAYVAPEQPPAPQWDMALLKSAETLREIHERHRAEMRKMWSEAANPIEDIRAYLQHQRREIDRKP